MTTNEPTYFHGVEHALEKLEELKAMYDQGSIDFDQYQNVRRMILFGQFSEQQRQRRLRQKEQAKHNWKKEGF